MPKDFIIRGLPRSIAQDGWWLNSASDGKSDPPYPALEQMGGPEKPFPEIAVVLLIVAGDYFIWGVNPALSLVLFAWCIFGLAAFCGRLLPHATKPAILLALTSLPTLEFLQPLSLGILGVGLLSALAWLWIIPLAGAAQFSATLFDLVQSLPLSGALTLIDRVSKAKTTTLQTAMPREKTPSVLVRNWAFPLGGALVLSALLIGANPVLERAVTQLFRLDLNLVDGLRRAVFWLGMGLLIWPLLTPRTAEVLPSFQMLSLSPKLGLNAGSVLRALVVFNLFLSVQTTLDFTILLGGATLPKDMSYATYAHRGAYPLLVTAMLAGAFSLAARPFLNEHRTMKPLLFMWLFQNVLLTLSAALRLDLYISEFGLTYLRIHALIWMALVAVGLMLVAWQVAQERPSVWLMLRAAALGFGTLYICTFVNFAALIANDHMTRIADPNTAFRTDWSYLCDLGPTAAKALHTAAAKHPSVRPPAWFATCWSAQDLPTHWREWDFRTWRISGYLG